MAYNEIFLIIFYIKHVNLKHVNVKHANVKHVNVLFEINWKRDIVFFLNNLYDNIKAFHYKISKIWLKWYRVIGTANLITVSILLCYINDVKNNITFPVYFE